MTPRLATVALVFAALLGAEPAFAFVTTPVGGHPGELDVEARLVAERGKIEPNENREAYQVSRGFYEYVFGAGYGWGNVGPLELVTTRLEFEYFQSPAERNDPTRWVVGPDQPPANPAVFEPRCASGAEYLGGGVCQFYAADTGFILTPSVSAAVVHERNFAFALFVRGQVPFGYEKQKFANPRLDYLATGWNMGLELRPWFSIESVFFVGSGTRPFGEEQNATVAITNLLHFHAERWLLPWRAGVKVGPYVEGDVTERFDARYDAAYSPQVLAQPGQPPVTARDRIRQARFASALFAYFLVTPRVSIELGYVQKWFGYDPRATQAWIGGVRVLFDLASSGTATTNRARR